MFDDLTEWICVRVKRLNIGKIYDCKDAKDFM